MSGPIAACSLPVLDHGYVELVDYMGDDLRIVQAAQASFDKASLSFEEREKGILNFLMREEHGVPFEHVVMTYRLKLPIFVARQLVKHRISSWSEQSGRYDELAPDYYIPETGNVRKQVGRPGAYTFEPMSPEDALVFADLLRYRSENAASDYTWALSNDVSKEQARLFLPTNFYTVVVWTINVRSFLNVIRLRDDDHAQWESREYARAMYMHAQEVIPATLELFETNGRPKP